VHRLGHGRELVVGLVVVVGCFAGHFRGGGSMTDHLLPRECTRRTRRGAGPDRERSACTGKKSRRIGFNLNYRTPKRTGHSDETISRFGVRMHDAIHTAY
jgi:hypothetical protein